MKEHIKVCLVASAGGHLSQLLRLEDSWHGRAIFHITTSDTVSKELLKNGCVYVVGECNREHPFRVVNVLIRCVSVILHERPDVVISTGAAVGCIVCFLAKMLGARIVWLDSIANVERISLSGRMVRYIADLFLVQWPELEQRYSNVEYVGAVI